MEKKKPSYTTGGNVNGCRHYGEQYGSSPEKLNIELPYDPAIPLLGIYPNKTLTQKDTCIPMFVTTLFTIARHGNSLNALKQRNGYRRCGTYTQWRTTQPWKKNEMMPFVATWMNLEIITLSEVSQKEKDKYHMKCHLYVESKVWHKLTCVQNRNWLGHREHNLWLPRGSGGIADANYYIGWINNKVLLFSIGNYILYPIINQNGKDYEKINT